MEKLSPSFGRRRARKLRMQAEQAYTEKLDQVRVKDEISFAWDCEEVWLEIGFGGGENFLAQLRQNPKIGMVGCEPFVNGVAKMLKELLPEDFPRVRIWPEDVRYLLEKIPSSYFSRIFILFPDPWPKKRHQRRRLINQPFMQELLRTLKKGGKVFIASDDGSYVEQILEVLSSCSVNLIEGPASPDSSLWEERPVSWPSTRYEQKAIVEGKPCAYMTFQKTKN